MRARRSALATCGSLDRRDPHPAGLAALIAGEFLVGTGEGDVYSEEEARRWLQETGWRALERKPLAGPVSVIVAETAQ